jgi:hypothetical protein
MNKNLQLVTVLFCLLLVTSCGNNKKPAEGKETVSSVQTDSTSQFNEKIKSKVGTWVKKGIECYGIVIVQFKDGRTIGKAVRCKVISMKPDKIKMKTVESVSLMESEGCNKLGLAYGDTWWETEGDLFKTKEEADKYLKEKGWYIK